MQQARDGVGQAAAHGQPRIDILLEGEAHEPREEEGGPDGRHEGQRVTKRKLRNPRVRR